MKMLGFEERDLPIINKFLEEIDRGKWRVRYFDSAPTSASLNQREIGVYDDGSAVRRIYFKTHLGTVCYINASGTL